MSRTIRITALAMAILAFFIFVGSPFRQAAQAFEVVTDAIIAIIIAGLAAIGITFATTGAFDSLNEYVRTLIDDYCDDHNISPSQFLNGTQSGTNSLGQILINNRFVVVISTFATWLQSKFSVADNTITTLETQGNYLGNCTLTELPTDGLYIRNNYNERWEMELVQIRGSSRTYVEGNGFYIFVSDSPSVVEYNLTVLNSITGAVKRTAHWEVTLSQSSFTINQYTFNPTSVYAAAKQEVDITTGNWVPAIADNSLADMAAAINAGYEIRHNEGIAIHSGDITVPLDDDNYTEGDGAIIDVGAQWGDTYGDVIEGIEGAFSDSEYLIPSITYEGEDEVQEQVQDTPAESISQEVGDYQSPGLQNVFPFCIPFDIYAFFECLAADPVAPSFTWRFYVPGICDEEIELDLSDFDSVAQVVRTMELLAFIVGLAIVTRNRFLRG